MGAAASIYYQGLAAGEAPVRESESSEKQLPHWPAVDAVVLDSPYTDFSQLARRSVRTTRWCLRVGVDWCRVASDDLELCSGKPRDTRSSALELSHKSKSEAGNVPELERMKRTSDAGAPRGRRAPRLRLAAAPGAIYNSVDF